MSLINRLGLLSALGAAVLAAGCATPQQKPLVFGQVADPQTPLDQYQITTHETPDQVGLSVHTEGVSGAQRVALAGFVDRWRAAGGGLVTMQVPADAADPVGARAFADAAVSTLGALGVPYENVRVIGYAAGPQPKPVVLASFNHVVADGPDCRSVGWENLTASKDNKPYARFGCTIVANLAAQIADPNDLRGDVPLAPGDNTRRMVVLGKYRDGKNTASDKEDQASGTVSQVKP